MKAEGPRFFRTTFSSVQALRTPVRVIDIAVVNIEEYIGEQANSWQADWEHPLSCKAATLQKPRRCADKQSSRTYIVSHFRAVLLTALSASLKLQHILLQIMRNLYQLQLDLLMA